MTKYNNDDLKQMQFLPLKAKISMTERRIREWYDTYDGSVYVSFSGGKDSTVLLDICRKIYPDIEAVFIDTGLEYPEIREFVKTISNVTWIKPEMSFKQVCQTYGYPFISKEVSQKIYEGRRATKNGNPDNYATRQFNGTYITKNGKTNNYSVKKWKPLYESNILISNKCCDVMKKRPAKLFEKSTNKKPIIGTMATESYARRQFWLNNGCNAFDTKRPISQPMAFWTENDVLQYIKENNISYCPIYGDIVETGGGARNCII